MSDLWNEPREGILIESDDYWFKIVGFLQQNWALFDQSENSVIVYFLDDGSGVFDQLDFSTEVLAKNALRLNGFSRYSEDPKAREFISPPAPPFRASSHPGGRIYSSGRFWIS